MRRHSIIVTAVAVLGWSSCSDSALTSLAYAPLPLGIVRPSSWLLRELRLQGDGLSGHFSGVWEPFYNSPWLGGNSSFENWEALFPYVLQGFVGQAVLLNDTTQLAQMNTWIEYILAHANSSWLGPDGPPPKGGMLFWPRVPILQSLFQLFESGGSARLINASIAWLHGMDARLVQHPLGYEWSGVRVHEFLFVIHYLIDCHATPPSEVPFLYDFAAQLYSAGAAIIDYERWFVEGVFPTGAVPESHCNLTNHGVNQAMALKSGALLFRQSGGDQLGNISTYRRLQLMDKYHGTPTGVFQADEHYAGLMPSHGTETCAVVELVNSHIINFETLGDALFAERAELIAYSAMPGSMTKDLWARVYLQQNNEVVSVLQDPHVWISDGSDAIIYSLEGNYYCCTASFNQGWPRFISRMLHTTPDGGIAITMLGPVTASLNGALANVSGDFPFDDDVTVTITAAAAAAMMPVEVRIPSWATDATIALNGGAPNSVGSHAGTMYRLPTDSFVSGAAGAGASLKCVLSTRPAIRVSTRWFNGAMSVQRGALVYALQLSESFAVIRDNGGGSFDYNVTQTLNSSGGVPWNAALVITDPADPASSFTFERVGPVPAVPFSSHESSVIIHARARAVSAWKFASDGSAAPPPVSPVDCSAEGACGEEVPVVLVPYGTTHLRMTQMPYIVRR